MTSQTGSDKKQPSESEGSPWEKKWNEVKQETAAVVKPVVEAVKGPWERVWGGDAATPARTTAKASIAPSRTSLEGDWKNINATYKEGQASREQMRLDTLKSELANEKDAKNIEALKREIGRVEKGIKGNG